MFGKRILYCSLRIKWIGIILEKDDVQFLICSIPVIEFINKASLTLLGPTQNIFSPPITYIVSFIVTALIVCRGVSIGVTCLQLLVL